LKNVGIDCVCSLDELATVRGRLGLGIERNLHFEARGPISAYIAAAAVSSRIRLII
jgi:hypothetical protein